MINQRRGYGLRLALLVLALAAGADLRAEGGDRLVCASGIRERGPIATLVHVTLVVPDGEDPERLGNAALAQLGARPFSASGPSPLFVLTGHKWPQFFPGATGDRVVVQHDNPAGQPFSGDARAALAASARTWTDVPTSSFTLFLGDETSAVDGFDNLNVIDWPATHNFSPGTLAVTITTFLRTTNEILDADVLINPSQRFALDPRPGDGTFDLQRVILHEDGHLAGLDHSLDPSAVMFATLGTGPQSHELARDDVEGLSALYPNHFKVDLPSPFRVTPRRR